MTNRAPDFKRFLRVEEEKLAAQLRAVRASIDHSGEKGRGLEHAAMGLIRSFLPPEYGVGTGFVASALPREGGGFDVTLSRQSDVVIYDALRGGAIVDLGPSQVYPLECVIGVVEVKTDLMEQLRDILQGSADIRRFRRRHFLINRNEVQTVSASEQGINNAMAALDMGPGFPVNTNVLHLDEYQLLESPVNLGDWRPIRTFALAFEYRRDGKAFHEGHLRKRVRKLFDADEFGLHYPHMHAVFVPSVCTFWHSISEETGHTTAEILLETEHPLAAFRRRLLESLATFPRPAPVMITDLRPYFGGEVY